MTDFRAVMAVQALLDRENLSCNCIDGVVGRRTRDALRVWQERQGLPATGELDAAVLDTFGDLDRAFTTHTVSSNELAMLTVVPEGWIGKSQAERLGYETVLEGVAEQYHASEGAIRRLNPSVPWPNPPAGTVLTVPDPFPHSKPKAAQVRISLSRKLVQALDAEGRVVGHFPCSIAQKAEKRPVGELKVAVLAPNPNYVYDPAMYSEDPQSAAISGKLVIPPGPNNPVGLAWIGLDRPGYGIHGSPRPEDIGKTESHGCFRLANWNAQKLIRMVSIGTPVIVEP